MARIASPFAPLSTRRLLALCVLLALAATWWTWLRPSFVADGPVQLIKVQGVSMEPGLHTGDLAVVYRRDDYAAGAVVAYRAGRTPDGDVVGSGPFIIHRITGGNGTAGFVLRGDNTTSDDPWRPTYDDVAGEMLFSVPGAAGAVAWLGQPMHAGGLLAGVFVALVLGAEPRRRTEPGEPVSAESSEPELVS